MAGKVKLSGTSGYVELAAPATAGSNTITLPTTNGSANQYLKNSGTAGELEFGPVDAAILQVVQSKKTDTGTTASANPTFADISGTDETGSGSVWECNITLTAANNVLVMPAAHMAFGNSLYVRLVRTTGGTDTNIAQGDGSSGAEVYYQGYSGSTGTGEQYYGTDVILVPWLDVNPGIGTHTYRLTWCNDSGYSASINKNSYDTSTYNGRPASTITLYEVKA